MHERRVKRLKLLAGLSACFFQAIPSVPGALDIKDMDAHSPLVQGDLLLSVLFLLGLPEALEVPK